MSDTARGSVEISAAKIDNEGRSWIEVMPTADEVRNGSQYFTITADDLAALVASVKANSDRIPVDRDHSGDVRGDTRAAGWFTGEALVVSAGEKDPNGDTQDHASAWALVKWTPAAVDEIRSGEFKFVSAEWSMTDRNKKTGLWTGFKDLVAATLTNRPFFKELAPVTASDLIDSDRLDALVKTHGQDVADLVLAVNAVDDPQVKKTIAALLAVNDGPELGDQVKAELIKALGLPEDADDAAVLAAVEAAKKPQTNESETKVNDYLKILGLDDTADPTKKINAALNDKDGKILGLEEKVTELTAKIKESEKLDDRIEELEKRDRVRDIEVFLAKAVDKGRVLPAEKDKLAEMFSDNVSGLKSLIATRPDGFASPRGKAIGSGGSADYADDADVARFTSNYKSPDPVDSESAKIHLLAVEILKEKGIKESDDNYTDEYIRAAEEASSNLVY